MRNVVKKASSKGGFFRFTFLSLGFLTVFPALPTIQLDSFLNGQVPGKPLPVAVEENAEERCRWQKDFSLMNDVEKKGTQAFEAEAPCSKEELASLAKTKGAQSHNELDTTIRTLVSGYPLEVMAPAIAQYDREVAALIVGIAKKESNWGKRVPRSPDGADCFNYWGYKGAGSRGTAMGHGCFGSPEEAVTAIGNRLATLVDIRGSEPADMIIWKCGSSCATHSPESVRKWISDVDIYYQKIAQK